MGRRTLLLIAAVVIAALGAVLIFLYVQGINDRAVANQQPVKVLTAKKEIATGTSVSAAQAAGDFQLSTVPKANVVPGALTDTTSLNGQVALSTVFPGEQIIPGHFGAPATAQKVIAIPKGDIAVSAQFSDTARVAGFIQPGSHVVMFISATPQQAANGATTTTSKTTGKNYTRLLLPNVLVIAVGSTTTIPQTTTTPSGAQTTQQVSQTILTVGVNQKDAEKIIYAQANGTLTLGLLTKNSVVKANAGINGSNLFK